MGISRNAQEGKLLPIQKLRKRYDQSRSSISKVPVIFTQRGLTIRNSLPVKPPHPGKTVITTFNRLLGHAVRHPDVDDGP